MASPTSAVPLKFWKWSSAIRTAGWTSSTVGRDPFRVVELLTEDPVLEGQVDYLEDREAPVEAQCRRKLIEEYETCHTLIFNSLPPTLKNSRMEGFPMRLHLPCPSTCFASSRFLNCAPNAKGRNACSGTSATGRRIYSKRRQCDKVPVATGTV